MDVSCELNGTVVCEHQINTANRSFCLSILHTWLRFQKASRKNHMGCVVSVLQAKNCHWPAWGMRTWQITALILLSAYHCESRIIQVHLIPIPVMSCNMEYELDYSSLKLRGGTSKLTYNGLYMKCKHTSAFETRALAKHLAPWCTLHISCK